MHIDMVRVVSAAPHQGNAVVVQHNDIHGFLWNVLLEMKLTL